MAKEQSPRQPAPVTVPDQHNAVYKIFDRLARGERNPARAALLRLEARKLASFEVDVVRRFDHITWVIQDDLAAVPAKAPTNVVIPNDGFSGKMSYHANVTAALYLVQEIMPLVWAHRPNSEVWLVGKDPAPAARALATDKVSGPTAMPVGNSRVVATGFVPRIETYIQQATVAVAPLIYRAGDSK